MNQTLETIFARASYRGPYSADKVPREELLTIARAGLAAPSGCNKQTTSILVVDDAETLKRLHGVIQLPVAESAPAMICVLTQRIDAYGGRCYQVQDYAAAIENMLLACVALGYQSCWYEGHLTREDRIGRQMADILHVPEDYDMVCMLPIGRALEQPRRAAKKPEEQRLWLNDFNAHF